MNYVIEIDDGEAPVLRETGSGGLLGRGLLAEGALADHVEPTETPRYVVRNKKQGFAVESTDEAESPAGPESEAEGPAGATPDGDHSAAALVTDARVVFAVGRADGDRLRALALSDVVAVRTTDGLLGGALVVDTAGGLRYRFPTRGDLAAVREFVDEARGVWTRAERRLEAAADTLDRADRAVESSDPDGALDAVEDARRALRRARETASALGGAAASVADRAAAYRDRTARVEHRARVERAERARERGHDDWDDGEYEAAFDRLDRADEAYAAAQSVDAGSPSDDEIERRRSELVDERDRLSAVPLERADDAVEAASSADDLETAIEWWERAMERWETLLSLDWGRDERRFAGDRETVRDRLATAAERLVEARCERARRALATADAAPETAAEAEGRAETALDAARELARERVPDAVDTVEDLRERLVERDGGRSADGESRADSERGEWVFADDERVAAARTGPVGDGTERTEPSAVEAESFRRLVADLLDSSGWDVDRVGDDDAAYDLRATAPGPVPVEAAVLAVHGGRSQSVAADRVDRFATAVEADPALDAAAIVAGGRLPDATRERAADSGVRVVGSDELAHARGAPGDVSADAPTAEANGGDDPAAGSE
ncbi:MAG: restriction endonuclease [Halosimplex sp.]